MIFGNNRTWKQDSVSQADTDKAGAVDQFTSMLFMSEFFNQTVRQASLLLQE